MSALGTETTKSIQTWFVVLQRIQECHKIESRVSFYEMYEFILRILKKKKEGSSSRLLRIERQMHLNILI